MNPRVARALLDAKPMIGEARSRGAEFRGHLADLSRISIEFRLAVDPFDGVHVTWPA